MFQRKSQCCLTKQWLRKRPVSLCTGSEPKFLASVRKHYKAELQVALSGQITLLSVESSPSINTFLMILKITCRFLTFGFCNMSVPLFWFLDWNDDLPAESFAHSLSFFSFSSFFFRYFKANYLTILWWFFHTFTWISHGCTCVPHPDPPSLPIPSLRVIPVHQPWAPCLMHRTWIGDLLI